MANGKKDSTWIVMIIALVVLFAGAIIASIVHTSGGSVKIHDITFVDETGAQLRALLYIPKNAAVSSPAPVVVSCSGYNNTAEVQDLNCIELSKRGFIVMAVDMYGHGRTDFPDERINAFAPDMGSYAAMQYIGTLPYADKTRVGLVGHSLGGAVIQTGAAKAWTAKAGNPNIVAPIAVLPTAQSFTVNNGNALLAPWPINLGSVFGQYDEFTQGMWGTAKGDELNTTAIAKAGMGFNNFDYGAYYGYGQNTPLDRNAAVRAAREGKFRVVYLVPHTHPRIHLNGRAVGSVVDFFDITLNEGKGTIPVNQQSWYGKQAGTGISLIAFFVFMVSFGLLLLKTPYFGAMVQKEPQGITAITNAASRIRYWVIFIIGLLPAPLLFFWTVGFPINNLAMPEQMPILMPASPAFPLPCVNGIFVLNFLTGIIAALLYLIVFFAFAKKSGCTADNTGCKLPGRLIFRAAVLAVCVFAAGYFLLVLCDYLFKTDFRFYVFSFRTLTAGKWVIFLRYLPSFLFFFIITGITQNTFTRINNQKEWVNIILIVLASCGGLFVLYLIDYLTLWITGVKAFLTIPGSDLPTGLAGILLWGLLFILPAAATMSRIFFRKTGSIWAGSFINALVVTLFAISNTVIAARVI